MKFENHHNHNCLIELDNGETYSVYAPWMHNQKIDNFKGWRCDAGVTRISIDQAGQVHCGECYDTDLGNLNTSWELLEESAAICKRDRCVGCPDDLMTKKYAITGTLT